MPKRYKEFRRLSNGHSRGITTVSFSSAGSYVATGGLDGKVCIWQLQSGKLLHSYAGQSSILCLEWLPSREDALLCGSQNGNVTVLTITAHAIIVNGFWAHKYPVECVAIADHYIATGAHRELTVWKWNTASRCFHRVQTLEEPPTGSHNQHQEVLVTSLRWTPASPTTSSMLMVSYMYHGIHLFETQTWGRVRTIPLQHQIASTSLSPNGEYLAISNLYKGFDVYEMTTEVLRRSFEHDVGEPYPTPVRFIHGGSVIVGGSTVGKVELWHLRLGKMPSLLIPKGAKVLCLADWYSAADEPGAYQFFLATGVMNENTSSYCIIWKTEELGTDRAATPGNIQDDNPPKEDAEVDAQGSSLLSNLVWAALCMGLFAYLVTIPTIKPLP